MELSDPLRCDCGALPATVVPVPMCSSCARAYYVVLVSLATASRGIAAAPPAQSPAAAQVTTAATPDSILVRDFVST